MLYIFNLKITNDYKKQSVEDTFQEYCMNLGEAVERIKEWVQQQSESYGWEYEHILIDNTYEYSKSVNRKRKHSLFKKKKDKFSCWFEIYEIDNSIRYKNSHEEYQETYNACKGNLNNLPVEEAKNLIKQLTIGVSYRVEITLHGTFVSRYETMWGNRVERRREVSDYDNADEMLGCKFVRGDVVKYLKEPFREYYVDVQATIQNPRNIFADFQWENTYSIVPIVNDEPDFDNCFMAHESELTFVKKYL